MTGMNTQSSDTAAGQSSDESAMSKSRILEVDKSCSVPVMFLLTWALAWLVGGGILAVISSIKLHGPGFLAGSAFLTYGRVQPASVNALLYGFGFQAARRS
jgi:cytochrome c oxidase cbb3-type subunit I